MYLDSDDKPRPRHRAGAWAAGVPGTVRGLGLAHARWGKLAWADLVQPAARLAREGFPISADLAGSLNSQLGEQKNTKTGHRDDRARLADFTESVSAFARPDGAAWKAGDRLIQSDLAATLQRIAAAGPDEFYTGRTAQLIARYMEEKDGRITADDLAAYQARLRPPVHTTFRGCDVWSMGPPSSGGVVLCQMLNILERFDLKAEGAQAPRTVHRITEAMRRAFFTRALRLGAPDLVPVPKSDGSAADQRWFLSDASSFQRLQPGGLCGRGLCRGGLRGGHDLGNGSVLDAVSAPMAENCRLTRSGHLARRSRKKRGKTGFKPRKSRKSPEN